MTTKIQGKIRNMKFSLPPVCFKAPIDRTENAANRHAQDASQNAAPSSDVQPENNRPPSYLRSRFQMLFVKERRQVSASAASASAATSLHRPAFNVFNFADEIAMVEEQAVGSVADYLSKTGKDTLTASQLDNMMQFHEEQGVKELDQKLEHALQNIPPEQSRKELKKTIDNAKKHLIQLLKEEFHSAGWAQPPRAERNLKWESSEGPLLLKRGLSLQQLKLDKADSASGKFASVSIFENENGDKLVGKISKNKIPDGKGGIADDLAAELKAYQTIYEAVGPHPNLVNVYGIAQVPNEHGEMTRAMLMDAVPGPIGEEAFAALRESSNAGKISNA